MLKSTPSLNEKINYWNMVIKVSEIMFQFEIILDIENNTISKPNSRFSTNLGYGSLANYHISNSRTIFGFNL